ncbi:MAG: DUF983 domain-containing protein [Rhodospirillaceae bacterium]
MSDKTYPQWTTGATVLLGLRVRCPRCGEGRIFSGYIKIADQCPVCGLGLAGHDVGDGPVVPAMLVIGTVVVGLALYVEFGYEPPWWVHVVLWGPLVVGMVLGMLPPLKGLSVALQHRYRSTEEEGRLGGT